MRVPVERRPGSTCILPGMDSLVAAAARALAAGDALGALKRVALRDDPPALALRGIAMAQLGDYPRARELLRRAARGFGAREELARRAAWSPRPRWRWPCATSAARRARSRRPRGRSMRCGDRANALQARLIAARRQLLLGELDGRRAALAAVDVDARRRAAAARGPRRADPAELALRRVRAADAAARSPAPMPPPSPPRIPALLAEVGRARHALSAPVGAPDPRRRGPAAAPRRGRGPARLRRPGRRRLPARLAGRRAGVAARRPAGPVRAGGALAEAWPGDVPRDRAHRARLPRAPPTSRTARGCASRSAACARSAPAGAHRGHRARLRARPASAAAPSSCWRRPSTATGRSLVALLDGGEPGRPRRSRWRSAPASAPSSARSPSSRTRRRCAPSGGPRAPLAGAAAGRIHDDLVTPGRAAGRVDCSAS